MVILQNSFFILGERGGRELWATEAEEDWAEEEGLAE